jgi:hypothetical protein
VDDAAGATDPAVVDSAARPRESDKLPLSNAAVALHSKFDSALKHEGNKRKVHYHYGYSITHIQFTSPADMVSTIYTIPVSNDSKIIKLKEEKVKQNRCINYTEEP